MFAEEVNNMAIKIECKNAPENVIIGNTMVAQTTVPAKLYDKISNITYWDTPGSIDNRGVN
jgi:hypothetical protein